MHDTSGSRLAPAIALTGVNLSLGRGAARVHILKDIDLHIGRGEAIAHRALARANRLLMVMAGLSGPTPAP
jgi:putative ABC transport system ATP-binding protein